MVAAALNACHPDTHTPDDVRTCEALNRLLCHELAAVDAYEEAVQYAPPVVVRLLHAIGASHAQRVQQLRQYVNTLDGEPSSGPGQWGVTARISMGTAVLLGPWRVLQSLVELEKRGVDEYRKEEKNLGGCSIVADLAEEQYRSWMMVARAWAN
jgi:hypothetical protein